MVTSRCVSCNELRVHPTTVNRTYLQQRLLVRICERMWCNTTPQRWWRPSRPTGGHAAKTAARHRQHCKSLQHCCPGRGRGMDEFPLPRGSACGISRRYMSCPEWVSEQFPNGCYLDTTVHCRQIHTDANFLPTIQHGRKAKDINLTTCELCGQILTNKHTKYYHHR